MSPGDMAHQREHQELRLHQRCQHQQQRHARPRTDAGEAADGGAKPIEHRGHESQAHQQRAGQGSGHRARGI